MAARTFLMGWMALMISGCWLIAGLEERGSGGAETTTSTQGGAGGGGGASGEGGT
jgi:hypothetical protein